MLANDVKKGTWGVMIGGWLCQFMDNKKGIIRLLDVYGYAHEMGSAYVWDIQWVYPESNGMSHEEFNDAIDRDEIDAETIDMSQAQLNSFAYAERSPRTSEQDSVRPLYLGDNIIK